MVGVVMAVTVIAAYDVSEDARRARLAAVLQTIGDRVQRSVFVLAVDDEELAELRDRALEIIDPATDSIYFFRQCGSCWGAVGCVGQAHPPARTLFWVVH